MSICYWTEFLTLKQYPNVRTTEYNDRHIRPSFTAKDHAIADNLDEIIKQAKKEEPEYYADYI